MKTSVPAKEAPKEITLTLKSDGNALRKIKVTTSTTIAADLLRQLGKERLDVQSLMPAGVDPHLYRAKESDTRKLLNADIVVHHGLYLEAKLSDVFSQLAKTKASIRLSDAFIETELISVSGHSKDYAAPTGAKESGGYDPHVWFDILLWGKAAKHSAHQLARLDPAGASFYLKNLDSYLKELSMLHVDVQTKLSVIPKPWRTLVTSHDAFSYFAKQYDFEVLALQGISTQSMPSRKDIKNLAMAIAKKKIPSIFAETSVSSKGLEAVLRETRYAYKTLQKQHPEQYASYTLPLLADRLYGDSLGPENSKASTYVSMFKYQIQTIVTALSTPRFSSPLLSIKTTDAPLLIQ